MKANDNGSTTLISVLAVVMFLFGFVIVYNFFNLYSINYDRLKNATPAVDLCKDCLKDGYTTAMPFFTLGIGILLLVQLLPRLKSFKAAGIELALQDLQDGIKGLKTASNQLQEQSVGAEALLQPAFESTSPNTSATGPEHDADSNPDPQKEKWGGKSKVNDRELTAEFFKGNYPNEYQLKIKVISDNNKPLHQAVRFYLPPTFRNPTPVIAPINNEAQLHLNSVSRAFTVGAETDSGETKLELDLAPLLDEFKKLRRA